MAVSFEWKCEEICCLLMLTIESRTVKKNHHTHCLTHVTFRSKKCSWCLNCRRLHSVCIWSKLFRTWRSANITWGQVIWVETSHFSPMMRYQISLILTPWLVGYSMFHNPPSICTCTRPLLSELLVWARAKETFVTRCQRRSNPRVVKITFTERI